jgi:nitrosocyanin
VSLAAADFSFNPSQLSVPAGASVTVTLQNTGKVEHSFTLDNGSVSQDADAGETKTVNFTAPQSGTLAFHCKYHPTQMKGTITVGGAGAGGGSSSSSSSSVGY